MKILFIVFPQRSHVNATLSLAHRFVRDGHEVWYAGSPRLREYLHSFGFRFHVRERDVYSWVEEAPTAALPIRLRLRRWYHGLRRLERYRHDYFRDGDLVPAATAVAPDLILVDRAYSVFAPGLFTTGIPFGILVSMGNLARSAGVPPLDTAFVPRRGLAGRAMTNLHWRRYFVDRWMRRYVDFRLEFDRRFLRNAELASGRPGFRFDTQRYFHVGVPDVPEFLLFPREFDLPRPLRKNQVHVGPFIETIREEENYDFAFEKTFAQWSGARKAGRPLVYCGLGTAAWRYRHSARLLRLLVRIAADQRWNLLIAGGDAASALPSARPHNVAVFQRVPQQRVLQAADLMLGHGGMNSIVEAIIAGVPLLICPGMSNADQAGNAARVSYHGIGQKVDPRRVRESELRRKINAVLNDAGYRQRTERMRSAILASSAHRQAEKLVYEALAINRPATAAEALSQ